MRKLLFLALLSVTFAAHAQTDSLSQYAGKYTFPEGTIITELSIVVENGTLMANSSQGSSEFRKTVEKDVFEVVEFEGLATFKRNDSGKVVGVKIEVNNMVLDGTKSEDAAYIRVIIPRPTCSLPYPVQQFAHQAVVR